MYFTEKKALFDLKSYGSLLIYLIKNLLRVFLFMNEFSSAIDQLLRRASGPMHIRLIIQPIMAILLAIRAGLKDARENKTPFLWEFAKNKEQRKVLTNTMFKDLSKLMILAFLLDFVYQIIDLKSFSLLQALIVMFVLALLPYMLLRGLVTRLHRLLVEK